MDTETTNSLTDILINVSELQIILLPIPDIGDSMELLCNIRKIGTGMLESEKAKDGMQSNPLDGYKDDAIVQMLQLHEMISAYIQGRYRQEGHDQTFFGLGLAADDLAKKIQHVFELCDCDELKKSLEN